jgi:DNA-binding SARP family transcriptional activator
VLDSGAEVGEPPAALLARGEILPDWYDDWLVIERERFRQLRVHALERLCDRLTAAGRFAEAVDAGLAAVESEPLRESAHRALIRTHLAEGNACEALRQYRAFRELLRRELGLRPSELMEALVRRLTVP